MDARIKRVGIRGLAIISSITPGMRLDRNCNNATWHSSRRAARWMIPDDLVRAFFRLSLSLASRRLVA